MGSYREEEQWQQLEACYKSGQPFLTTIIEANPEDILVNVGGMRRRVLPWYYHYMWALRQEIDANQDKREQMLAATVRQMPGQTARLRVKEVDRHLHHLVLAQYIMTEEERQQQQARRERLLEELQPGDVRRGIVSALSPHTVRIDLGGVEGIVFRNELSQSRISNASELVYVGQKVDVLILKKEHNTFLLSMKRVLQDEAPLRQLRSGERRTGRVFSLTASGAFVDIGGVYGLIPTAQLAQGYITHPADLFHNGQELEVTIVSVDREEKKIILAWSKTSL